jgi:molybdenum cofactor biosynthesis enzyme MoaA
MLTRRCNMTCGHCSVASGPQVKGEPAEADLLGYLRQAATAGVRSIQLTGGEPMLREPLVLRLLHECQRLGLASAMTTNGFWGRTLADARRRLHTLRGAGLVVLTVSYDRYHSEFQDPQPLLNIARAADELNFPININIVRVREDPELRPIVAHF